MKKILLLLHIIMLLFLVGCHQQNKNNTKIKTVSSVFDHTYECNDIFVLKDNTISLNSVYFDINNKTINNDIKNKIISWCEAHQEIGILIDKNISFNKVENFAKQSIFYTCGDTNNNKYQLIKINTLALFSVNQDNLFLNQNNVQFYFLDNDQAIFKTYFKIANNNLLKHISTITLASGERISHVSLENNHNTTAIFIIPGLTETYFKYQKLMKELFEKINLNIHYLFYPGFYNSTRLADGFNIEDLSNWLKRVVNHYEYSSVGFVSAYEGHLLMRKLAGENAINRTIDNMFYVSINPISETGLNITNNSELLKTKKDMLTNNEIKNMYQVITNKDKTTLSIQLEQLDFYATNDSFTKLNIVDEFINKNTYLDLMCCFNNVNFQGFANNMNCNNYQEHIDNRYSFKKGVFSKKYYKELENLSKRHNHNWSDPMFDHLYEQMETEPYFSPDYYMEEKDSGDYFFKPHFKDGFIYVITKHHLNNKPMDFFTNSLKSFNDIIFLNDFLSQDSLDKLIVRLKHLGEEIPYYYLTNNKLLEILSLLYSLDKEQLSCFINILRGETKRFFRIDMRFNECILKILNKLLLAYDTEVFLNNLKENEFEQDIKNLKVTFLASPKEFFKTNHTDYYVRIKNKYDATLDNIIKKTITIDDLFTSLREKINLLA